MGWRKKKIDGPKKKIVKAFIFKYQQKRPMLVSSAVFIPAYEATSTTALLPPS